MDSSSTLRRIRDLGVLAVLRGPSADLTVQMVDALVAGGIRGIEVTYTTPNATEVVGTLNGQYGDDILLGMGTVTTPAEAEAALAAGAQFLVSPHCEDELAHAMVAAGVPVMIGAFTPSEVVHAHRLGADVVKLFPASTGGPEHMKALHGPFPDIPLMPTGGVSRDNVHEWFAAGAFAVGVGSALCPTAWAREGRFADITERAAEFNRVVKRAQQATVNR